MENDKQIYLMVVKPEIVTAVKWDGTNEEEIKNILKWKSKKPCYSGVDMVEIPGEIPDDIHYHLLYEGDYIVEFPDRSPRIAIGHEFEERYKPITKEQALICKMFYYLLENDPKKLKMIFNDMLCEYKNTGDYR